MAAWGAVMRTEGTVEYGMVWAGVGILALVIAVVRWRAAVRRRTAHRRTARSPAENGHPADNEHPADHRLSVKNERSAGVASISSPLHRPPLHRPLVLDDVADLDHARRFVPLTGTTRVIVTSTGVG